VANSINQKGTIYITEKTMRRLEMNHLIEPSGILAYLFPPIIEIGALVNFRIIVRAMNWFVPEIAVSRNESGDGMTNNAKFVERFKLLRKLSSKSLCRCVPTHLLSRLFAEGAFDCRAGCLRHVYENSFDVRVNLGVRVDHPP
jgi:hypothetical protein